VSGFQSAVQLVYLAVAACFVLGLHLMNSPRTARRGNLLSAAAMGVALVATIAVLAEDGVIRPRGVLVLSVGLLVGAVAGAWGARVVQLTDMPQLVSLFNAAGGGAAALVAFVDTVHRGGHLPATSTIALAAVLDVAIGVLTLSGSLVAAGKLQGIVSGNPVFFVGIRVLSGVLVAVVVGAGAALYAGHGGTVALAAVGVAALALGVTMVLPIGGADMPVVISLLNACTGCAVAMAGFMLASSVLITAGALVGASGGILTRLMAVAMNRSLVRIVLGGFGGTEAVTTGAGPASATGVRATTSDDVAIQLAYATRVVVVPGYGLAAAQAQHEMAALAAQLTAHGVEVLYAIHPVAGRMPGHMNVLLAEANVPYELMRDLEESNAELPTADVALVVGANDVTNPAARRADSAIHGMPILDVDKARSVIVLKRSMGHGYAGIDNELYANARTGMYFCDAKAGLAAINAAVKELVH
jgi:NAD(P) transhydrogenase subunit beta